MYEWFLSHSRGTSNTPPTASAGAAQSITLPLSTVTLTGAGAGTGGASVASYAWTKASGPAGSSFTAANASTTGVTGLSQGVHVFRLTVTDNNGLTAVSTVTVTVLAAPVAIAGPSQTISTTSTVLNAAASYSPNGSIAAYDWMQVSGPVVTIANAHSATPMVSNMIIGSSYAFQLTVTDVAGASGSAVTGVTVMASLLPVEFTYFKGQQGTAGNLLQWATASEQNNEYFAVERSTDGNQFVGIGRVTGAGTSNIVSTYVYTDTKAPAGNSYYRLKQVDKDGQFNFSKTILVSNNSKIAAAQLYPNPVQASLSVLVNNDSKGNGNIAVYDVTGQQVRQQTVVKNDRVLQTAVNMDNLVPGLYLVEIKIGNSYKYTKSILKQ